MSCNPILTEVEFQFLERIKKLRTTNRSQLTKFFPYQTTYKTVDRMVVKGFLVEDSREEESNEYRLSSYGRTILRAVETHRRPKPRNMTLVLDVSQRFH